MKQQRTHETVPDHRFYPYTREEDNTMNRRTLLTSLSVAGATSLAGCAALQPQSTQGTVLGRIEVINFSQSPNRIRLLVQRGDETVFDQQLELTAAGSKDDGWWELIPPAWNKAQGLYQITATHYNSANKRESAKWTYKFSNTDYQTYYQDESDDPGCIGAIVKIGSHGTTRNEPISISPARLTNPCGSP